MSLACLDFAVTRMYSSTAVSENVVQKKRKMYTTVFKGMMGSITSLIANSTGGCITKLLIGRPIFLVLVYFPSIKVF